MFQFSRLCYDSIRLKSSNLPFLKVNISLFFIFLLSFNRCLLLASCFLLLAFLTIYFSEGIICRGKLFVAESFHNLQKKYRVPLK